MVERLVHITSKGIYGFVSVSVFLSLSFEMLVSDHSVSHISEFGSYRYMGDKTYDSSRNL